MSCDDINISVYGERANCNWYPATHTGRKVIKSIVQLYDCRLSQNGPRIVAAVGRMLWL
jgi:Zn-finger protein